MKNKKLTHLDYINEFIYQLKLDSEDLYYEFKYLGDCVDLEDKLNKIKYKSMFCLEHLCDYLKELREDLPFPEVENYDE